MPDEPLTQGQVNAILRDLSNNQKEVTTELASIFDALSKLDPEEYSSGALKAIGVACTLVAMLSPDPDAAVKGSIVRLAKALRTAFEMLQAQNAASEAMARETFLNDALRSTVDVLGDLKIAVQQPDFFHAGDLILKCQGAVSLFLHDEISRATDTIWHITRSTAEVQKIYWSDSQRMSECWNTTVDAKWCSNPDVACYGTQYPPFDDSNATVFEYRLALPAFLWAVTSLLLVGRTLRPDFVAKMSDYLGEVQAKLEWIHGKIRREGITALSPRNWRAEGLEQAACPWHDGFCDTRAPIAVDYKREGKDDFRYAVRASIECGAVEKFSGNSSVVEYTVDMRTADMCPSEDENVFLKLQLRVLGHTKRLYANCGLPEVKETICTLQRLRGETPDEAPGVVDWTMVEAFNALQWPTSGAARSLRAMATLLVRTQPFDTPYNPNGPNPELSLRRLLSVSDCT